jgi:Immunoglobulin I-set domain/ZU5 domain
MRRITYFIGVLASAWILAGCGGGDSGGETPPLERPSGTALVGAAGATIEGVDGARVEVPAGALGSGGAELSISIARDSTDAPGVPAGFRPLGDMFAVTPHGIHFLQPVTVTVPFDAAALPADRKPALLKVTPGRPWQVIESVTVSAGTVSAQVTSLSFLQPISVPRGGLFVVNPPTQPPPTQASFSMTLENSGWTSLPPTGTNARIFQQSAVDDPALVRWQVALPSASELVQSCWTGDVRAGLVQHTAALYRRPGDPQAGTNRVAIDPSTRESLDGVLVAETLQSRVTSVWANAARWDPLPPGRVGLAALLGPSPDIPADAIVDGVGVQVHLQVSCLEPGTGGWFGNQPNVVWVHETGIAPIVVARGFEPPPIAVVVHPQSRSVLEGQYVSDDPIEAFHQLNFTPTTSVPLGTARWERAAPGTDNWQPVPTALITDPPPNGTLYSIARSDGALPAQTRLLGQALAARDNGWRYRARFCLAGTASAAPACATSRPATLRVSTQYPQPRFTTQPRSQTFQSGQTLSLTAAFAGFPLPARVTWQTRSADDQPWQDVDTGTWLNQVRPDAIPDLAFWQAFSDGADTLVSTRPLTIADRGRQFRATYTTVGGTATSQGATINVTTGQTPPTISTQPGDLTVGAGQTAVFTALADGAMPLSYQWTFNGQRIPGANAPTLVLGSVNAANAGLYALEVGNVEDTVRSRSVRLTVTGATPPPVLAITTAPAAQTVMAGGTATFAVVASGAVPLTYQWEREGQAIAGATTAVLTVTNVGEAQAGNYTVLVSNGNGSVRSQPARLTVQTVQPPVLTPPSIDTAPVGLAVTQGQRAILAVGASGSGPLAYQWFRSGSALPGATAAVLVIDAAAAADGGNYTVTVSNSAGSATSAAAGLLVLAPPGAPSISRQPASTTVIAGAAATFSLEVKGDPTPQCLWLRNGVAIEGATSCRAYSTPATSGADNGVVYNVVVYSPGGVAIGNGALLTVQPGVAPTITRQPTDWSTTEGGQAQFEGMATGTPLPDYAWLVDGAELPPLSGNHAQGACTFAYDALGGNFALGSVSLGCNGRVVTWRVTNTFGSVTSNPVVLRVAPAVPANALTATQVIAGQEWSLALRPDRSVWAWGNRYSSNGHFESGTGNLTTTWGGGVPTGTDALRPVRIYPAALTDIRAVSGWYDAFWAIKGEPGTSSSRVLHWGWARSGADGRGADGNGNAGSVPQYRYNNQTPVEVLTGPGQPVDRVCTIAGGADRLLMIRAIDDANLTTDCATGSAKTVWMVGSWTSIPSQSAGVAQKLPGLPPSGTAGYSPPSVVFQQLGNTSPDIAAIALEDGRAYGIGNNAYNGFGLSPPSFGSLGPAPAAPLPSTWGTVRGFGAGFYYSLFAIRSDGSVMASGYDGSGELGLGNPSQGQVNGPLPVLAETCTSLPCANELTGVSAVESMFASLTTLALKNGQILGWGVAGNGLLGPGVTGIQRFPRPVPSAVTGFTALSASWAHAVVIGPGNVVYGWGNGARGALGNGQSSGTVSAPTMVTQ